jgi:hypothetical protein
MEPHPNHIGSSLRAERERLGLSLKEAESETRIRARYLEALEEERFDDLPGEAYVRGFLRSYAAYLGLDGAQYLAAYRARVRVPQPAIAPVPVGTPAPPRVWALAAAVAVAALVAIALGAWRLEEREPTEPPPPTGPHPESIVTAPAAPPAAPPPAPPATAPPVRPAPEPPAVLILTARGGDCWLEVRIGGPGGRQAWTGTLRRGQTLRFGLQRALFIRAGAPHNLHATVAGRQQPPLSPTANDLVVTRQGLAPRG